MAKIKYSSRFFERNGKPIKEFYVKDILRIVKGYASGELKLADVRYALKHRKVRKSRRKR